MPIARLNGIDLHYEVDGEGDWIVFAHGGDGNHLCWWRQVAAFAPRYRCLTYDARGFGASGGVMGDPAASGADDLLAVMDHAGVERAVLVGHSMGGLAVSGVAQSNPERVRGLVMGDTPFGFQTEALSRWAAQMIEKIPAGFDVFAHLFAPGFAAAEPALHHLYWALCRLNTLRPQQPRSGDDYLAAYVRMRDLPPGDYLKFPVPSLFLVGDQDALTLPWLIEETARAVGGATFVTISGAGHSAFYEQADAYNAAVEGFLQRLG